MKTSIYEFFLQTVQRNPEKTAIIEGEQSLTFRQLQNSVFILSKELIKHNISPRAVVAVLLKKSMHAVISDLAISGVGSVYMNLDVKSPLPRIKQILGVVQPILLITDEQGSQSLSEIQASGLSILNLNQLNLFGVSEELLNPAESRIADVVDTDPYCIINTSGSTGVPKSVVLNHRSFIDFARWSSKTLNINGGEVVGSLSPIIFDIFSYELCMLAYNGSTLCLIDDRLAPYPAKILNILEENKVSFIFWVPTIMVNIANMGLLNKFTLKDLKQVWFAGEVFPTVHFNKWFDRFEGVQFVNLYGPIEITLDCTYFIVRDRIPDELPIPMGSPCRNTSLLVLDKNGNEVPEGQTGELYVRGTSLAMGYYNNPEQTDLSFVLNPLNSFYKEIIYKTGDLVTFKDRLYYFKGRADSMIKHLGYRIELGDIEHAILSHIKAIRNVCVVYAADRKEIIAYCELEEALPFADFRAQLMGRLPAYMMPGKMITVERMPMNANGKIDRLYFNRLSALQ